MMNRGITDDQIIEMIKSRRLIQGVGGHIYKYHDSRMKYLRLKVIEHWKSGRFQYVIRRKDDYRKIGRGKLLMMIERCEVIPNHLEVDHYNHDKSDDSLNNLRLREKSENRRDNWSKENADEVIKFFEEIAQSSK